MVDKSKTQDRWATFGKVSAVIILLCTVIAAVTGVYSLLAGKADIKVTVSSSVFRYPPNLEMKDDVKTSPTYDRFVGYFKFEISNEGGAQADNVVLDLPYFGVAEIRSEDEAMAQRKFATSIPIGSIRPHKRKTVYVWTTDAPASYKEKYISVTHTQGTGNIKFVRETAGFWNAIYEHLPSWIWPLLFVIGIIPWLIDNAKRNFRIDEMLKREKKK